MLYISPIKNYRQPIHKGVPERHAVTGDIIGWKIKPLAAAFGTLGDEQQVFNPLTQTMETLADITTGVYDTEVAQQKEGWTDEERLIVERALDAEAAAKPVFVRKLEVVHVPADAPWQTYDQTSPDKIVALATELGLVPEALRYERENANREPIVTALELGMDPDDASRAEPLEKVDIPPVEKPNVRIAKAPRTTRSGIVVETEGLTLKEDPGPEVPAGQTIV